MLAFVASNLIWLLPLVLSAIAGSLYLVLPMLRPWMKDLKPEHRAALAAMTKGAALVVAGVSRTTPTTLDDDLAKILLAVSDELGRPFTAKEAETVKRMAIALHTDGTKGHITFSPGIPSQSLAKPVKELLKSLPADLAKGVVR